MDHTATKVFKECPRKYFYRIVCGRVLDNSALADIFAWGSAVHRFAEDAWDGKGMSTAFASGLQIYKTPKVDSKWAFLDIARFTKTCAALYEFYEKEEASGAVEIKGIEQPFNINLPDGTRIGGRFDQIFTRNGRLLVRDWKTTTQQTQWFQLTLNPNDQATRYAYAASKLAGWDPKDPVKGKVDGVEFVVIENQKPTKSDNRLPKISTIFISKSAHDLIGWEREQVFLYKQIDHCRSMDIWPMHENHCNWCDYASVCRQPTDSSREWKLKNDFKLSFWDHQTVDQKDES
jgi:hypothetical protein